jgi:hypothetical protein
MTLKDKLLLVSSTFAEARGLSASRVSTLAFGDGKIIDRLRVGSDLTTGRFESGMEWFSQNWPAGAEWPCSVERPREEARP